MADTSGTLKPDEYHPAADAAMKYIKEYLIDHGFITTLEEFASTALSGDRLAEVCCETLRRIIGGQPVSDRYLLGLAWVMKQMKEIEKIIDEGEAECEDSLV